MEVDECLVFIDLVITSNNRKEQSFPPKTQLLRLQISTIEVNLEKTPSFLVKNNFWPT